MFKHMQKFNTAANVCGIMAGLGCVVGAAHAQFDFDGGTNHFVGIEPDGVAGGDFNGDGLTDLAVVADQNPSGDDLAILLGNADGTFQIPFYVVLPNSSSPHSVVAGDLDGDGDVDLAVSLQDNSSVIAVLNQGGANFVTGSTASAGQEPRGMDIGDADNDGDLDIIVGNRESSSVSFLLNNGNATFSSQTLASGDDVRDAGWGDFDGDGDLDGAVASHDDRTVRVFANNGGSFSQSAVLSVGGDDRPEGLDTGDINGDGIDDIAAASGDDDSTFENRVVIFFANSVSSFNGPNYVQTNGMDTGDVTVADLDCDGDLDLATANELTNNVSMMLNSGGGAFGAPMIFGAGSTPDAIIATDLGNDGDDDVVVVNDNSSNITVYLSNCGSGGGPVCGNGVCEMGEDAMSCPADCDTGGPVCGNGVCEMGEDSVNCPSDCGGGGGPGDFTFNSSTVAVGDQPDSAAAGDFNGDSITDLAVVADQNANADDIAILLGQGGGSFAAPFYVNLPNSSSPGNVVAGDLDGDGDIDLAVVLKDNNVVATLVNNGGANFSLGSLASTGAEPRGIDIADADNDGDLDLVVANREGNSISFLINNGGGTFASSTQSAGNDPRDAVWGDFDGDGDQDGAISNHDDRTIGIFTNNGGTFSSSSTISVGSEDRPEGLDTGDLNGDGLDDIATASGDDGSGIAGGPIFNRVIVFLSQGGGSFSGPAFYNTNGTDSSDVALADLDCDGDLDAATANQGSNDLSLLANNGAGALGAPVLVNAGSNPDSLLAADLDGDMATDLVAVNRNSNNISVLLNTSTGCDTGGPVCGDGVCEMGEDEVSCPEDCDMGGPAADLNGDGSVNGADLGILLGNFGSDGLGDLNNDGVVDGADLGELLGDWTG